MAKQSPEVIIKKLESALEIMKINLGRRNDPVLELFKEAYKGVSEAVDENDSDD